MNLSLLLNWKLSSFTRSVHSHLSSFFAPVRVILSIKRALKPFTPASPESRDTQDVITGITVKSDSFLQKDQFPLMHFLIITLSRPQTIIWICHALFVLLPNCINHTASVSRGLEWICHRNIKHSPAAVASFPGKISRLWLASKFV